MLLLLLSSQWDKTALPPRQIACGGDKAIFLAGETGELLLRQQMLPQ
jgi:hypothetical protein